MDGKVVLITGSTSGIGLETAKLFYQQGATILLTCRDDMKGRKAIDAVQSSVLAPVNDNSHRIHLFTLDLMSYESIIDFCNDVKASFNRLDVLVLNAGVMGKSFELSSYGIESHFATNMFGHNIVLNHFVPLLEAAAGRVIIVSSGKYVGAERMPTMRQLMGEELWDYKPKNAYALSKLCNCVFGYSLANRFAETRKPIHVYVYRPGFIRGTELGREYHWLLRKIFAPLIYFFSKSVREGAEPIVYLATTNADELEDGHLYNNDCRYEDYTSMVNTGTAIWLYDSLMEMERLVLERGQWPDDFKRLADAARSW